MKKSKIHIIGKLPTQRFGLALSGGVDGMAILHFLLNGKRFPELIHINHGTDHGHEAEQFVTATASKFGLPLHIHKIDKVIESNHEKQWSDERYKFFESFDFPIITCHHLDDCVETYLFSCLRGFQSVIPYRRNNVIRPFLLTEKEALIEFATSNGIDWVQDQSNFENDHARNKIRNQLIPIATKIAPGLKTTVKRMVMEHK